MSGKKGILERLKEGPVIGDGGYVIALEKRGYCRAGPYTPEASIEHPDAVLGLHKEFLRAGSDVIQAFTFYSTDEKLRFSAREGEKIYNSREINEAGCKLAKTAASDFGALVAGSISHCPLYAEGAGKAKVQAEFQKQLDEFIKYKVDFVICEFMHSVEQMEWAIEVVLAAGFPVATTLAIGTCGDNDGVPIGECAVRMARAGAQIVGVNCMFDPLTTLESIREMKKALDAAGLKPYLMTQPNGYHTTGCSNKGWFDLPEYPFAIEPRTITRWDAQQYARAAVEAGVRYVGGCCGFEAYHIRGLAEELAPERGNRLPPSSTKHGSWGAALKESVYKRFSKRVGRDYWLNLKLTTGRREDNNC